MSEEKELAGRRFDQGKVPMHLLPFIALKEIAKVLAFGEKKYGAWNWAKGMKWSRVESPLQRHYEKYQRGLDLDEESGLYHTAHIACNALFLLTFQLLGLGEDDRHTMMTKQEEEKQKELKDKKEG